MVQYACYNGLHGTEQAAHQSYFPVKILKSPEQSSVDYSLPAHTFVSFFYYQVAALLPYPTACFLVFSHHHILKDCAGWEFYCLSRRGALAERILHVIF
jgi:hypothetical protein